MTRNNSGDGEGTARVTRHVSDPTRTLSLFIQWQKAAVNLCDVWGHVQSSVSVECAAKCHWLVVSLASYGIHYYHLNLTFMDVVTLGQKRLTEFHRSSHLACPPKVPTTLSILWWLLLDQDKVDVVGTSELNFDLLDSATPNDDASACRSHMNCRYRTLSSRHSTTTDVMKVIDHPTTPNRAPKSRDSDRSRYVCFELCIRIIPALQEYFVHLPSSDRTRRPCGQLNKFHSTYATLFEGKRILAAHVMQHDV